MAVQPRLLCDLRPTSYFLLVEHPELDVICGGYRVDWVLDYACLSGRYVSHPFSKIVEVIGDHLLMEVLMC